ncbi:unnamed protein product, partial [marine sediment metagenome]
MSLPAYVVILKSDFNTSKDSVQPNVTIYFNDTSAGCYTINNWSWNFSDGNVNYSQNTSHNYTSDGNYNVTLNVTDSQSNNHSYYQIIYIDSVSPKIISVFNIHDTVIVDSEVTINADFFDNQSG